MNKLQVYNLLRVKKICGGFSTKYTVNILPFQKTFFFSNTAFNKQNNGWSPYNVLVEVLVSSENAVYIHDSYIVVSWLCRCISVEISNKTLTMTKTLSTILYYVDVVSIALDLLS